MKGDKMKRALIFIACVFLVLPSIGFAQQNENMQTIHSEIPNFVQKLDLTPTGQIDSTKQLDLVIGLYLKNQLGLKMLLHELYDPTNIQYHDFLSYSQFVSEFDPSEQDYETVMAFMKLNGLKVTHIYSDRTLLGISGSVSTIEKVFHVQLNIYRDSARNRYFYAPNVEPTIVLGIPLRGITGLSNYNIPQPADLGLNYRKSLKLAEEAGSGPDSSYIGNDFRAAYAPKVTLDGEGQKVGILEGYFLDKYLDSVGFHPSDIIAYDSIAGLRKVPIKSILIDNANGIPSPLTVGEVSVDIEMANAMAPGLDSIIVYDGDIYSPEDILDAMVTNTSVKQFSSSWGHYENRNCYALFEQLAAQGQSFFNSSGDWGAWGQPTIGDTLVTIVGGTALTTAGPGGKWTSEVVWNAGNDTNSSGGGFDMIEDWPLPSYQKYVDMSNIGGSNEYRNGPDVAMVGTNILYYFNGGWGIGAGTSYSTPLWASFMALANEEADSLGNGAMGCINYAIYPLGMSPSYDSEFHDVTSGNNINYSGSGYGAAGGYDLCTGWGSPSGQILINFLSNSVWSGTKVLSSNYTLPSGQTLIIAPGTTVKLGSGVSIIVDGVLDAAGTSSEPITFTSTSGTSASSWEDIELNGSGASGSTISYANIQYAYEIDVENVPDFTISNCDFLDNQKSVYAYNSSGSILYNTMTSNSNGHSIEILNSTDVNCISNTITKTSPNEQTGSGIQYGTSSGDAIGNDISYCDWGIGADWSGSVESLLSTYPGLNNRIRNCAIGLEVYRDSYATLGIPSAGDHYGHNSIYDNTTNAEIGITYSSYASGAYACYNWWGSNPPNTSKFSVGSDAYFYYEPYLESDPYDDMGKALAGGSKIVMPQDDPNTSISSAEPDSILDGMSLREKGDYKSAMDLFMAYINNHPDNQQAYVELYGCFNNETGNDIIGFFKSLPSQASKDNDLLLAIMYMKEGNIDMAEKVNNDIITDNPNTSLAERATINNAYISLFNENNIDDAVNIYDEAANTPALSTSAELSDVRDAIDTYAKVHGKSLSNYPALEKTNSLTEVMPKSYSLLGNYPNPFNPTTNISYDLPELSKVEITIYDVLGREVRTFDISSQSAGRQFVTWDGRDNEGEEVASGVYLYHFKAVSLEKDNKVYETSAKMIMLK
jgi:tetratricopeptide (TPR) repeat protein